MSAATTALNETDPVDPFGVARKELAICPEAGNTASVPAPVIGDPANESHDGTVMARLTTVPPLAPEACFQDAQL
jgi:hypothetical protein